MICPICIYICIGSTVWCEIKHQVFHRFFLFGYFEMARIIWDCGEGFAKRQFDVFSPQEIPMEVNLRPFLVLNVFRFR